MFRYSLLLIILLSTACRDAESTKVLETNKAVEGIDENAYQAMEREWVDTLRDQWQKPYEVIAQFGNLKNKKIMDLGSGAGYFTIKLAEKGAEVIAAEVNPSFLHFIDSLKIPLGFSSIETRLVPYDHPNLRPNEVDGVLLVNVYYQMENRNHYFKHVLKGLKANGKLIIAEHFPDKCMDKMPPAKIRISPEKIKEEIATCGFSSIEIKTNVLECQYLVIATK